jgi:transposase
MAKKTVTEIANIFNVSETAVRLWIKKGLKTETEKVIGIKPRMVIDENDVYKFLGVKKEKEVI